MQAGITTLDMSGQRKQAVQLAKVVQEWNKTYEMSPKQQTKHVHNSLCDVLDSLNAWLEAAEGSPRVVGNRELGPINKSWNKLL